MGAISKLNLSRAKEVAAILRCRPAEAADLLIDRGWHDFLADRTAAAHSSPRLAAELRELNKQRKSIKVLAAA